MNVFAAHNNRMEQDELMLSALVGAANNRSQPKISRSDQHSYLDKYISTVSIEDRQQLATIIVTEGCRDALHSCPDGVVVDLSTLSDGIIRKMYDLLEHIREKQNTPSYDGDNITSE